MVLILVCITAAVLTAVIIARSRPGQRTDTGRSPDAHAGNSDTAVPDDDEAYTDADSVMSRRTAQTLAEGDIPAWDDLSDREKTALSVWSEDGGPLEDLHLSDD